MMMMMVSFSCKSKEVWEGMKSRVHGVAYLFNLRKKETLLAQMKDD